MAITNKGGFDDLNAQEQDEDLGTRRKIGFGNPARPQEFSSETPAEGELRDDRDTMLEPNETGRQGD